MLKGPTGSGKTRFVEHIAWRLGRPLVTMACHDDLGASDLIGRFLIRHDGTIWQDGPLTRAVRERRDLLSGRGGRGAPGHGRCAASA
jgi:nitric oxide reductase NorQ protein